MTSAPARTTDQPSDYVESSVEKFNEQNRENIELVADEVVVCAGGKLVRDHSGAIVTAVGGDSTTENRQDTNIDVYGCVSEVCESSVSRTFEKNYEITADGKSITSASRRSEEIGVSIKQYMAPYVRSGYVDISTVVGVDLQVSLLTLGLGLVRITSAACGARASLATVVLDKHPMRKFANYVAGGLVRRSNVKSEMRVAGTHLRAWYIFGPRNKKPGYVTAMIEKEEELMKKKEQAAANKGQVAAARSSDSILLSEGSTQTLVTSDDILLAQAGHYEFSSGFLARAADSADEVYSVIDDPIYESIDDIVVNSARFDLSDDVLAQSGHFYESIDDIIVNSTKFDFSDDVLAQSGHYEFSSGFLRQAADSPDDILTQISGMGNSAQSKAGGMYDTPLNALSTKGGSGVYDTPLNAFSTKGGSNVYASLNPATKDGSSMYTSLNSLSTKGGSGMYDTPLHALSTKGGSGMYDTPLHALSTKGGSGMYDTPLHALSTKGGSGMYDTPLHALSTKGGSGMYDTPLNALSTKGGSYDTPLNALSTARGGSLTTSEILAASYLVPVSAPGELAIPGVTGNYLSSAFISATGGASPPIPATFYSMHPDVHQQALGPVFISRISSAQIQQMLTAGTDPLLGPAPLAALHPPPWSSNTATLPQGFPTNRYSGGFVYLRTLMAA